VSGVIKKKLLGTDQLLKHFSDCQTTTPIPQNNFKIPDLLNQDFVVRIYHIILTDATFNFYWIPLRSLQHLSSAVSLYD
jgi:hypothetical protein